MGALPLGLEVADVPSKVNSRRRRLAPTGEDLPMITKSARAVFFLLVVGQNLVESKPSGRRGTLVDWDGSGETAVRGPIWHTEFIGDLAGQLLPVRRWRRQPVDALARRMLHEGDVSIMVSGRPDFGARTSRSTASYLGTREKAPVGKGDSDAAVAVQRQGRTRDGGQRRLALRGTTRGGGASNGSKILDEDRLHWTIG